MYLQPDFDSTSVAQILAIVIVVIIIVAVVMYNSHQKKKSEEFRQRRIIKCTALKKFGAQCESCVYPNDPKGLGTLQCAMNSEDKHVYGVCCGYNGFIMPGNGCPKCGSTKAMLFDGFLAKCSSCYETFLLSHLE